jgi:hypothetical protein
MHSLFKQGYESDSPMEEDEDYSQFTQPPPYRISLSLQDSGLQATSILLQGKREKALHMLEIKRLIEQYKRLDLAAFQQAIHADIVQHLDNWKGLCETVDKSCSGWKPWNREMGKHFLQWEARLIANLVQDWEAISGGEDNDRYISVYLARWDRR